jgi:RNA polymerase sporulation-specific sigma factor
MELKLRKGKLARVLQECLTAREREIIVMRYGLLDGKEITQNEIGNLLGISRSYVSRLEKKALQKLKAGYAKYE